MPSDAASLRASVVLTALLALALAADAWRRITRRRSLPLDGPSRLP
jgi:hypothetical protein